MVNTLIAMDIIGVRARAELNLKLLSYPLNDENINNKWEKTIETYGSKHVCEMQPNNYITSHPFDPYRLHSDSLWILTDTDTGIHLGHRLANTFLRFGKEFPCTVSKNGKESQHPSVRCCAWNTPRAKLEIVRIEKLRNIRLSFLSWIQSNKSSPYNDFLWREEVYDSPW